VSTGEVIGGALRQVGQAVTVVATDSYARVDASLDWTARVAGKVERILDQVIDTLDAAAPLVPAVVEAVEDGLIDDVRAALVRIDDAVTIVTTVSQQIEQAMPVLDATAGGIGVVGSTIGTTIGTVQAIPGARLISRRIGLGGRRTTVVELPSDVADEVLG
jgi:hypothetical protein